MSGPKYKTFNEPFASVLLFSLFVERQAEWGHPHTHGHTSKSCIFSCNYHIIYTTYNMQRVWTYYIHHWILTGLYTPFSLLVYMYMYIYLYVKIFISGCYSSAQTKYTHER